MSNETSKNMAKFINYGADNYDWLSNKTGQPVAEYITGAPDDTLDEIIGYMCDLGELIREICHLEGFINPFTSDIKRIRTKNDGFVCRLATTYAADRAGNDFASEKVTMLAEHWCLGAAHYLDTDRVEPEFRDMYYRFLQNEGLTSDMSLSNNRYDDDDDYGYDYGGRGRSSGRGRRGRSSGRGRGRGGRSARRSRGGRSREDQYDDYGYTRSDDDREYYRERRESRRGSRRNNKVTGDRPHFDYSINQKSARERNAPQPETPKNEVASLFALYDQGLVGVYKETPKPEPKPEPTTTRSRTRTERKERVVEEQPRIMSKQETLDREAAAARGETLDTRVERNWDTERTERTERTSRTRRRERRSERAQRNSRESERNTARQEHTTEREHNMSDTITIRKDELRQFIVAQVKLGMEQQQASGTKLSDAAIMEFCTEAVAYGLDEIVVAINGKHEVQPRDMESYDEHEISGNERFYSKKGDIVVPAVDLKQIPENVSQESRIAKENNGVGKVLAFADPERFVTTVYNDVSPKFSALADAKGDFTLVPTTAEVRLPIDVDNHETIITEVARFNDIHRLLTKLQFDGSDRAKYIASVLNDAATQAYNQYLAMIIGNVNVDNFFVDFSEAEDAIAGDEDLAVFKEAYQINQEDFIATNFAVKFKVPESQDQQFMIVIERKQMVVACTKALNKQIRISKRNAFADLEFSRHPVMYTACRRIAKFANQLAPWSAITFIDVFNTRLQVITSEIPGSSKYKIAQI